MDIFHLYYLYYAIVIIKLLGYNRYFWTVTNGYALNCYKAHINWSKYIFWIEFNHLPLFVSVYICRISLPLAHRAFTLYLYIGNLLYELFKWIIIYKATKRTYEVLCLAVKQGEYTAYILVEAHSVFFCASGHKRPANELRTAPMLACILVHCYYLSFINILV